MFLYLRFCEVFLPFAFEKSLHLSSAQVTYGPVAELGRRYTATGCIVNASLPHMEVSCKTVSVSTSLDCLFSPTA
jgi:hypothetical protein